jgi:hypothetical protein
MKLATTFVFGTSLVKELLIDLKERRRYWDLKEKVLDHTV